jgi:hypothetical protein
MNQKANNVTARTIAVVMLVVALSGASAQAREAGDKGRAMGLLKEGAALLDQKDFEAALEKFTEAYRLVPSPKIQFNIGLAQEGLARPAEATRAYRAYVDGATSDAAARRAEAETRIKNLRPRVTLLVLTTDVKGATVIVDGEEAGETPLPQPLVVNPGSHQLVVNPAGGGAPWTRAIRAEAGRTVELHATLQAPAVPVAATPAPEPKKAPVNLAAAEPAEPSKPPTLVSAPTPEAEESPPVYKRGWFWATVGGVVAAGAVTAVLLMPHDTKFTCQVPPCVAGN